MCRFLPAKIVAFILGFSRAASLPAQSDWPTCKPAGSFSYLEDEGPIRCFALRFSLVLKGKGDAAFIAFDSGAAAPHHLLGICGKKSCFFTADAKDLHGPGEPGTLPEVPTGQPVEITLRRDEWRMSALCEGRILARAYDSEVFGGKIGTCAVPGTIANVRLQPTDRVYFADDFMRESKESSEWQACSGEWRLAGIEDNRIDPQRSSNAFVYEGLPGDGRVAASLTGRWYWGGRKVEVAVKPLESESVGLFLSWSEISSGVSCLRGLGGCQQFHRGAVCLQGSPYGRARLFECW